MPVQIQPAAEVRSLSGLSLIYSRSEGALGVRPEVHSIQSQRDPSANMYQAPTTCPAPSQALGPSHELTALPAWLSVRPSGGGGDGLQQTHKYKITKRRKCCERRSRGEMRSISLFRGRVSLDLHYTDICWSLGGHHWE